jgi:nucleoside-diphosphate-sugar epimerase
LVREDRSVFQRIFLTGCTGFAGGYLRRALKAAFPSAEIMLLRRSDHMPEEAGFLNPIADIADFAAIDALIANFKPDIIFPSCGSSFGRAIC